MIRWASRLIVESQPTLASSYQRLLERKIMNDHEHPLRVCLDKTVFSQSGQVVVWSIREIKPVGSWAILNRRSPDVREAAQFNSVPHDLVVGQQAYRDRETYSPGERLTDQDNQTVNYREMDDKLKDERDNSSQKFKEATEEIANLRQEMEIQKDTIREAEDKLHKSLHDSSQTQNHLQNEIIALRSQLHEKVMKVTELEGTVQERERALQSARETLVEVQERVHVLQKGKEEIIRTNTEECQKLEANREVALVELRERLLNEKEGALQQLQFELEKDKEESLTKVQEDSEKFRKLMKAELEERINELTDLKGKLKQLEEAKETLGIQMRKEAEEQIQRAILTEREIWQMEAERKQEAEKRVMEESLGGEVKRMRVEMEKLKQDKEHLKESMKILKEENNKLRDENLAAGREKVEAVSEAREETRKDIQAQLDKM
ncbi:putative trichohyalin isoform X1, partial [Apostichopus japonicus]